MLEKLYQEQIITLARQSKQRSALTNPELTAKVDNPLCGDRVTIDLVLKKSIIENIGVTVRGCALCEAASEVLAINASQQTFSAIQDAETALRNYLSRNSDNPPWAQLSVFEPVKEVTSRHECVLLPFVAIRKAFLSKGE
ncbi:iron-sulfur cluster assembly scaffold protein [Rhodospirillaceae bacterium]|nr:iron-sulfur cluster assembly scaffold protein [Rhodospirillaceae bacterium]MDC0998387.1 iron-sulfur cluster assembly scaffold protein [Alphaproteobacteria bacterium]MDC1441588.1 iron-sulfur cluster assembly scaffold protein [Rhodospirillaceae bacterium]